MAIKPTFLGDTHMLVCEFNTLLNSNPAFLMENHPELFEIADIVLVIKSKLYKCPKDLIKCLKHLPKRDVKKAIKIALSQMNPQYYADGRPYTAPIEMIKQAFNVK